MPIPLHRDFEEINLRFYVRRRAAAGWRRGVVFVKEIVPRLAIALTARWLYNENYVALPTGNEIRRASNNPSNIESVKYHWNFHGKTDSIVLATRGEPSHFVEGSQEEFITQHYWGYSAQRNGGAVEYRVDHPPWRPWQAADCRFDCNVEALYGKSFAPALNRPPLSAFLAEGSQVNVYRGRRVG
jgi:uncharacterized protein YqjF (DUF2071 family)